MTDNAYTIRTATPQDVALAVDWAAAEGWNPGLSDAPCYGGIDAGGFLVGELDGEVIATISAIRYGKGFGFIGFYIVRPDKRGQGYGWQLWQAGMDQLKGRVIGLDGVVAQQDNYRKSGFELAYRNIRYKGHGGDACPECPSDFDRNIRPLADIPFDEFAAFDRPFFPEARPDFLRAWIAQPEVTARALVRNGKLAGYGVCRPCREGYKIGPLYAEDAKGAESLFAALTATVPTGAPYYLDTPETNPAAVSLAKRHGMTLSFETARMYAGQAPDLPVDRLFGVTSFEVG